MRTEMLQLRHRSGAGELLCGSTVGNTTPATGAGDGDGEGDCEPAIDCPLPLPPPGFCDLYVQHLLHQVWFDHCTDQQRPHVHIGLNGTRLPWCVLSRINCATDAVPVLAAKRDRRRSLRRLRCHAGDGGGKMARAARTLGMQCLA